MLPSKKHNKAGFQGPKEDLEPMVNKNDANKYAIKCIIKSSNLNKTSGKLEGEIRLKKIIIQDHTEPNISHNSRLIFIKINHQEDQHIDPNSLIHQLCPNRII